MEAKKPCYTCKDNFIIEKKQFLLNKKIDDVKKSAAQNGFTGIIAIVPLNDGAGYKAIPQEHLTGAETIEQYISFNSGVAI